ncbi:WXG100 family type VII secretion target [Actinoallomurus sp. NPDC052308]|uniref:WXG100 family type VII secretion target n=1 Tax=Actinoallomurus sp. NPDC052308 TaxID=3155530 RepID=UPI00341CE477
MTETYHVTNPVPPGLNSMATGTQYWETYNTADSGNGAPMSHSIDGTQIRVSDMLSNAGATINAKAAAIADELARLKSKLVPLQEDWQQSQASTFYQDMQNEWDIAANGLFGPDGVLGRIAHAMNVNWNNYSEAEWSNVSTWKH